MAPQISHKRIYTSSNGYWEENCGYKSTCCYKNKFPGTIVNIEVNLSDKNMYLSKKEKTGFNKAVENIF